MKRLLVASGVALAAFSCQREEDRATEAVVEKLIVSQGRESSVEIDRDHGSIRVTLGGAIKPAGWPSAVPVYPHAERAKIDGATDASRRLSVVTGDSLPELRAYYRDALAHDGWSVAGDTGKDIAWSARRGDENLEIVFAERSLGKGSRAQMQYRKNS